MVCGFVVSLVGGCVLICDFVFGGEGCGILCGSNVSSNQVTETAIVCRVLFSLM